MLAKHNYYLHLYFCTVNQSTGHKRTSGAGRSLNGEGSGQAKAPKESPPNKKARNSKVAESAVNPEISSSSSPVKPETLVDIFCDPENPKKVQFQEVSAAAYKIKTGIFRTPCSVSDCRNQKVEYKYTFIIFISQLCDDILMNDKIFTKRKKMIF